MSNQEYLEKILQGVHARMVSDDSIDAVRLELIWHYLRRGSGSVRVKVGGQVVSMVLTRRGRAAYWFVDVQRAGVRQRRYAGTHDDVSTASILAALGRMD